MTSKESKPATAIAALVLIALFASQALVSYPWIIAAMINGLVWMVNILLLILGVTFSVLIASDDEKIKEFNKQVKERMVANQSPFSRIWINILWMAAMFIVSAWSLLIVHVSALVLWYYVRNQYINNDF